MLCGRPRSGTALAQPDLRGRRVIAPTEEAMKAIIGGIIGALLMAGVLLFVNGSSAPALQAAGTYAPALQASAPLAPAMVQVPLAQAQAAGLVAPLPDVVASPALAPAVQTFAPAPQVVERVV